MKLTEYKGKELFRTYGISTPRSALISGPQESCPLPFPFVLKSQVLAGDRKKKGGIIVVDSDEAYKAAKDVLFALPIDGEVPEYLLAEEFVSAVGEFYISISYTGEARGPVLSLNKTGGSGIHEALITPIDPLLGPTEASTRTALMAAGFEVEDIAPLADVISALWKLTEKEYAALAEINPLFKTADNTYIAGDAKVVLDEEKYNPTERRYVEMDGDIAMMLSGGGASMLMMDVLLEGGGRPANYTEYSGNPPAAVVEELAKKVLAKKGLRACLVAGAAANFTDIYETLSGFLSGLRSLPEKPLYPIVIRRDGPRRAEAFEMLRAAGEAEGFDFHLYDETTPMVEAARIAAKLAAAYTPQ